MAKKRLTAILDIIKENGFVTVKYLCDHLHYSTATINRDLNELQVQGLINRNHGGAELVVKKYAPLVFRFEKNKQIKINLAEKAADLISDNMTIFMDGSTTAQFIGKHITKHKNMTVITNNINLAAYLSEAGVQVICLGGKIYEAPYITGGSDAAKHAQTYTADLAFFSTSSVTSNGIINCGSYFFDIFTVMIKNSKKSVYIADSSKIDFGASRILCNFSQIDVVISDYVFKDEVKANFPNTEFIEIKPFTQEE